MLVKRIEGATRVFGKGQGYAGLPVRDEKVRLDPVPLGPDGQPVAAEQNQMVSAWEMLPDELLGILNGSSVILTVMGDAHPPVHIGVSPMKEAFPAQDAVGMAVKSLQAIADLRPDEAAERSREIAVEALKKLSGSIGSTLRGFVAVSKNATVRNGVFFQTVGPTVEEVKKRVAKEGLIGLTEIKPCRLDVVG